MPYQARGLSQELSVQLDAFLRNNNISELYQRYAWGNDTFANGFPEIMALEIRLSESERTTGITLDDVQAVARWGAMRNQGRIAGNNIVLAVNALINANGVVNPRIEITPEEPIAVLAQVRGLGPTYQSKVLRFALPSEYGAIDTRVVRVFGQGDPMSHQHDWLTVRSTRGMHNGRATGWYIPAAQRGWPQGYTHWINILRYLVQALPNNCPHPEQFTESGLRQNGEWTCADVEMALFSYASLHV